MSATTQGWETFADADHETLADIAELELRELEVESQPVTETEDLYAAPSEEDVAAELADELQGWTGALEETDELLEGEVRQAGRLGEFYASITSRTQGPLRGDATRTGKIVGIDFRYGVTSPSDVSSGQATGRRQHAPVTMTKAWDAASPQLLAAVARNEVIDSVVFEFMRIAKEGGSEVLQTLKLTNARVSSFKQVIDRGRQLEEIAFTFERIEMANAAAKTMAVDQWGRSMRST